MAYLYKIGTTLVGLVTLDSLGVPAPENSFSPFSTSVVTGAGLVKGMGFPVCEWHWGFLTEAQRDALKVYCPGQSASVFISTLDEDLDYEDYECVLVWPTGGESRRSGRAVDLTLSFRQMVIQP